MTDMIDERRLREFIRESNRIEGIDREPTEDEIKVVGAFVEFPAVDIMDLQAAVSVFQPGARLRANQGMDVRVGNYIPPRGGPEIRTRLENLLTHMHKHAPHAVHCSYEDLHPFTDGNGRSGRLLWLWMMVKRDGQMPPLDFLHQFYYQTLAASHD